MAFVLLSAAIRATAFSVPRSGTSSISAVATSACRLHQHNRPSSSTAAFGLRSASSRLFSTAAATDEATTEESAVPITLLAGFLGSGKTTALKNLLENRDGIKVGVIVNDVASVNIDAKPIASPGNDGEAPAASSGEVDAGAAIETDYGGTVELQNGCACCSLADELLTSVETLMDGRNFDAVVVELSGVADPVAVKQNWDVARLVSWLDVLLTDSMLLDFRKTFISCICITQYVFVLGLYTDIFILIVFISLPSQSPERPPCYQIGQREPRGDRRGFLHLWYRLDDVGQRRRSGQLD